MIESSCDMHNMSGCHKSTVGQYVQEEYICIQEQSLSVTVELSPAEHPYIRISIFNNGARPGPGESLHKRT